MTGKNPRQIALSVLQSRRQNGEFTEILLDRALASGGPSSAPGAAQTKIMSSADRGLCQELVYGVVRAQSALDWLIARKTDGRQQNTGIQNVLRLGIYQLFWLDRIPAHAAVHETVELAKREGFGPKAGFVNAVLRGFLREFDATKKMLADLRLSHPAIAFSHPQWLVERWEKRFGTERMRHLLEWNNTPPKIFARVNTLKTDAGKLLERWRNENVEYDFVRRDFLSGPDREAIIFELKSHPPLASLESFRDGWFYVQDPGTLLAALELAPQAGETILDLCAAPGGKATLIAQLMGNTGKIMASDVSEERLKLLNENCVRLGVTSVEPIQNSNLDTQELEFDRILIDAPCSNSGVLRRRVDLRWRISLDELARLRQVQMDLLALAAPKLKPGGILIYSTCSLEPEENELVVPAFLKEHKTFELERQRELLPFVDNVDGAFVARLRRVG
ncbi:MAG TPA: 16S rRNA (cytosine(967)-C(5))-methyltransferase RsmB [Verrucomicrobiae bacterium]|nr:16S rRNA (cytosine(967)-C(5))-methyltransferase RsmB [Verrucomicrobiae bacterium]